MFRALRVYLALLFLLFVVVAIVVAVVHATSLALVLC